MHWAKLRRSQNPVSVFTLALVNVCVGLGQMAYAQVDGPTVNVPDVDTGQVEFSKNADAIPLASLGKPPLEIESLIKRGSVRLITGDVTTNRPDTLPVGRRLAGETRFKFHYRYDSHARWQVQRARFGNATAPQNVDIRVRFRSIKLITSHEVWLRDPPQADGFWDHPLVRHEFDHVRISSDPRIEKMFLDLAKQLERIRVPRSEVAGAGGSIDSERVQTLIESRMKQALAQTTQYVRIRYAELDRLTQHGMLPIPADSGLIEIPSEVFEGIE